MNRLFRIPLLGLALWLALGSTGGCSRAFYRKRADREAEQAIVDKSRDPRWNVGEFRLFPDPRSRFYDPYTPDKPPTPPDDPAANESAPQPQKPYCTLPAPVEGVGYRDLIPTFQPQIPPENTVTQVGLQDLSSSSENMPSAANPGDRTVSVFDPLLAPESPIGVLTPATAHQLALINSREYQEKKESLYLAALDVTLERYAFAPQWLVSQEALYEHIGRMLPGGDHPDHVVSRPGRPVGRPGRAGVNVVVPGASGNSTAPNGQTISPFIGPGPLPGAGVGVGVGRLLTTGGALLLRFANQTVFEFSGPFKGTHSDSTISLNAMQPLLQGAGKAVTLEPLTQAERNLLYEARSYARFQREFFVNIATGDRLLQGARLADEQRADDQADQPRKSLGFLPLIEQVQTLRNEQRNLVLLEAYERRFAAFHKAGEVSLIQLDQVRQNVALARSRVLRAQRRYFANLDRFKLQLGVPTNQPLGIDEQVLAPLTLDSEKCEIPNLPPSLDPLPFDAQQAETIALENRLDLMNARAALVDYWRKVAVSANGLLGILDLKYTGDWHTPDPLASSHPLDFRSQRSQHQLSLITELPLVRQKERNQYRATLIDYQVARRRLMKLEDTVRLEVRDALRKLYQARQDYEIQRNAVVLACRRVDQTRRMLALPPLPGEKREFGTNSARDLLEAQQALVNAQNRLVESLVDYQTANLELLRDLELLNTNDPAVIHYGIVNTATPAPAPIIENPDENLSNVVQGSWRAHRPDSDH